MKTNLKLALLQMDCQWEDRTANLKHADSLLNLVDADLVVLPEMFATGFSMQPERVAESMSGPSVEWMQQEAAKRQIALFGSLAIHELVEERTCYFNRLVFVFPNGKICWYDKRHLFRMGGENEHYEPGVKRLVVEYLGWRICPLVCYDLRFPVWSRNGDDYDLLLYVANWPAPRRKVWNTLLEARAIENLCYVAGVNRVGKDPLTTYVGDSVIVDYKGNPIAQAEQRREGGVESVSAGSSTASSALQVGEAVVQAQLDLEALRAFRTKFPAHLDADAFRLE